MKMRSDNSPVVLTIAGTDPSGGAGINVDLQVFRDHGVHGVAAITAVVWQNTQEIRGWRPVKPGELRAQMEAVADDFELSAVKIGMVPTAELVGEVARFVSGVDSGVDVVIDPVMVGGRGEQELTTAEGRGAMSALRERVDLLTPNTPEARELLGSSSSMSPEETVQALQSSGWSRVLLKGGHCRRDDELAVDWYGGDSAVEALEGLAPVGEDVRGTGCQLSSAIAARRAHGDGWREAISKARRYLNGLLHNKARRLGKGRPIVVRTGETR